MLHFSLVSDHFVDSCWLQFNRRWTFLLNLLFQRCNRRRQPPGNKTRLTNNSSHSLRQIASNALTGNQVEFTWFIKLPNQKQSSGISLNIFCRKQGQIKHGKTIEPIDQSGGIGQFLDNNFFLKFLSKLACQGASLS